MSYRNKCTIHFDVQYIGEVILKFSSKINGGDMFYQFLPNGRVTQMAAPNYLFYSILIG